MLVPNMGQININHQYQGGKGLSIQTCPRPTHAARLTFKGLAQNAMHGGGFAWTLMHDGGGTIINQVIHDGGGSHETGGLRENSAERSHRAKQQPDVVAIRLVGRPIR